MRTSFRWLVFLTIAAAAPAQGFDEARRELLYRSASYLESHPDMERRRAGLTAYAKGRYPLAADAFRAAARYADKPSQAMYAEMLWRGEGAAQDRALAYCWMDLAAERGYRLLRAKRDFYWRSLSAAEQARAQELAAEVFEQYGDPVAKPRLERKLQHAVRRRTGSRVGHVGNMKVTTLDDSELVDYRGDEYFDRQFWEPDRYWALQDDEWRIATNGQVEIGPLQLESNGQ